MGDEIYITLFDVPTRQENRYGYLKYDPTPTMVKRRRAVFFTITGLGKNVKLDGQKTVTATQRTVFKGKLNRHCHNRLEALYKWEIRF